MGLTSFSGEAIKQKREKGASEQLGGIKIVYPEPCKEINRRIPAPIHPSLTFTGFDFRLVSVSFLRVHFWWLMFMGNQKGHHSFSKRASRILRQTHLVALWNLGIPRHFLVSFHDPCFRQWDKGPARNRRKPMNHLDHQSGGHKL